MEEIYHLKASRKAHRAHLTRIFRKINEILQSDAIPNVKQTTTLRTSLEQIKVKKVTVTELDSRIIERIQDPDRQWCCSMQVMIEIINHLPYSSKFPWSNIFVIFVNFAIIML